MKVSWTVLEVVNPKAFREHDFSDGLMLYGMYQCIHCKVLVPDLENIDNMCVERIRDERSRSGFQI